MSFSIKNVFRWQYMLKPEEVQGEMPSNRAIYKRTFDIAWPAAVENVFITMIGAVDTAMVGTLGKEALSAVGITAQPKFIILAPILALNIGVTVLVSRRKGEGNQAEANGYLSTALLIACVGAVLLSFAGIFFARDFLLLAGAGEDYIDLAVTYFQIIEIGNIFNSIGLTITSAQRGVGNTRISMVTNLAANLVNVILNALLIHGMFFFPRLGVKGAAIATMIGNMVSFLIALASIVRPQQYLRLQLSSLFHPCKKYFLDLWNICRNSLVEQVFLRIGFFTYAKAVAGLGTAAYAAHMVCMNIMTISFGLGDGLQVANTSLVGQSMGQKRVDLAKVYTGVSKRIGILMALVVSILIVVFADGIASFFTQDAEVIRLCEIPLSILALTVLCQIPQVIIVGALRGSGDVKFVAALMLVSVTIVRPILAYVLCYGAGWGLVGAWIALACDQLTRNVLSSIRFRMGKWQSIVL